MPFPKRLLTDDEEIVLDLRPHWIMLVRPILLTLLILAAAVAGGITLARWDTTTGNIPWFAIPAGALVLFCGAALPGFLKWATTQFVLTNERLIARSGVVAKRSKEIPLEVINDITFTQTLGARILGAGTLIVESAGERGQEQFGNIRKPEVIQKAIYAAAEKRKGLGRQAPSASPISVADEVAKLVALRDSGALTPEEFEAQKARLLGS